jgi:outer membrane protein assembly factor BamD (BamD/ComL family)
MAEQKSGNSTQTIGIFIMAAGAVLCALQVYALLHTGSENLLDYGARAVAYLLFGVGLGSALVAIGDLAGTKAKTSEPSSDISEASPSQLNDLSTRIESFLSKSEAIRFGLADSPRIDPDALLRIEHLLREIRELSLLGDVDRRDRLVHHLEQRKRVMSRQITDLTNAHEFAKAEAVLLDLESQFPNDAHAIGCRRDLEAARGENESTMVLQGCEKVQHLIAIGAWDQALMTVKLLVENFPQNTEATELLMRVAHERDLFLDTSAQAEYDQVRRQIDQRQWRQALTGAQQIIARYPMHGRAQQMRQQFRTIQENADIEERHEVEARIQEMIRTGQFRDAIDLAEEILRRFPGSPQAQAVEEMLPRLQDLANEPRESVA